MELKLTKSTVKLPHVRGLNRTFYGIETRCGWCPGNDLFRLNRTFYGIETLIVAVLDILVGRS